MIFAGIGHLTFARREFQAQVPAWLPVPADLVVLASGAVEIALGVAMIVLTGKRAVVGLLLAAFFVVIFPGNIAQWLHHRDAFGLNSDRARFLRLFFQPVLIAWGAVVHRGLASGQGAEKISFQSSFMLTTVHPRSGASLSAATNVPLLVGFTS